MSCDLFEINREEREEEEEEEEEEEKAFSVHAEKKEQIKKDNTYSLECRTNSFV